MERAFFSNIRKQIIHHLDSAQNEVVVAMAWFTSSELFDSLIRCLYRNVKVDLVLLDNATNFMDYAPDFNKLILAGGKVRIATSDKGFLHHKFCVIDNNVVITGSYNWTYYAENRNIENIIITDNLDAVSAYKTEFESLRTLLPEVGTCPRMTWEEISNNSHINTEELNYEIENISKVKNLPVRKIIKSTTTVSIEEKPINPISRYNIGIMDNQNNIDPIILAGDKLPKTAEATYYNYIEDRSSLNLGIFYSQGDNQQIVSETPITEITGNRRDDELEIQVQFTLVQSGDLISEVRCVETGKVICVKAFNSNFISYED